MATFNQITEVILFPIDLEADYVQFVDADAVKAYNGFISGRPFMAFASGTSDSEVWWNPATFTQMRVTRVPSETDMTDNFCTKRSGGGCDGDFILDTPQGSFCINASDIAGCDEYDEEIYPFAFLAGAVLTDGDTYTSNLSSNTYYVEDGILALHGYAVLVNADGGVKVYFTFAEGSSCDEKVEDATDVVAQFAVEVVYGDGGGFGPK